MCHVKQSWYSVVLSFYSENKLCKFTIYEKVAINNTN